MSIRFSSPTLKFSISGLRGHVPADLNPFNIPEFIEAFHKTVPAGKIAVAKDARESSDFIEKLVVATLISLGRDVIVLGMVSTPTIKAYVRLKKLAGGIMISASHNPLPYNAFKFIAKGGDFFSEELNQRWKQYLSVKNNDQSFTEKFGMEIKEDSAADLHLQHVLSVIQLNLSRKIKIVIDPVASCGISFLDPLKQIKNLEVISIHDKKATKFPRQPEPTKKALSKLSIAVKESGADIGFALDPDADRLAVVGKGGKLFSEEATLPLAMLGALPNRKGPVVVNLSSSFWNEYVAKKFSRNLYRSKVGEANVVELMRKKKAAFGGEGNGGVIDPKIASFGRDSLSGMIWILKLLTDQEKSINEIMDEFPAVFLLKEKLPAASKAELKKLFIKAKKEFSKWDVNEEDGLRLTHPTGLPWIHLRASNTEPIVRIFCEAHSKAEAKKIIARL